MSKITNGGSTQDAL